MEPRNPGNLRFPPRRPQRLAGFTLIELVFVLILMGILVTMVAPSLNGITPRYRMRTYGRNIAQSIQEMRVVAVARGKTTGIRYVLLDDKQYYEKVPPASAEYPDEPLSERKSLLQFETPPAVSIRGIVLPGMGSAITSGVVNVGFAPNGTTGSHIIILELEDEDGEHQVLSVKYNSISGVLDFYNREVEFQHYEF